MRCTGAFRLLLLVGCLCADTEGYTQNVKGHNDRDAAAERSSGPQLDSTNSHARYRIEYNVAKDRIYLLKRTKNEWKVKNGHRYILRPGVHTFVEVRMTNFNDLAGVPKVEYGFENLHQEYREMFANAYMTVTRPPVPEVELQEDTKVQDSVPQGDTTLKLHDCPFMCHVKSAQDTLATLVSNAKAQISDIAEAYWIKLGSLTKPPHTAVEVLEKPKLLMELCDTGQTNVCDNDTLTALRDSLLKAYHKFGMLGVERIHANFKERFDAASKLSMTPDKEALKEVLDAAIATAFTAAWWDQLEGSTIQAKLTGMVNKAAELKALPTGREKDTLLAQAKEIQEWYHQLTTYANFAFAPIQVKDMDILHIQFKQGENNLNGAPYEFFTTGGWKMDFSAGLAATGLMNHQYYYADIRQETVVGLGADSTTTPQTRNYGTIRQMKQGQFDWSIAVLAHAYPRTGRVPSLGITTGVLLRPENVQWLFGGSLILGHRNRLVLSAGGTLGSVQVLTDSQVEGNEVQLTSDQLNAPPATQPRMESAFFASVTFNFGGVQLTR